MGALESCQLIIRGVAFIVNGGCRHAGRVVESSQVESVEVVVVTRRRRSNRKRDALEQHTGKSLLRSLLHCLFAKLGQRMKKISLLPSATGGRNLVVVEVLVVGVVGGGWHFLTAQRLDCGLPLINNIEMARGRAEWEINTTKRVCLMVVKLVEAG